MATRLFDDDGLYCGPEAHDSEDWAGSSAYSGGFYSPEHEATDEDPTEHADGCFPASGSGGVGECRLAWTGITCPVHSCDLHDGVRDESGDLPRL